MTKAITKLGTVKEFYDYLMSPVGMLSRASQFSSTLFFNKALKQALINETDQCKLEISSLKGALEHSISPEIVEKRIDILWERIRRIDYILNRTAISKRIVKK